MISESQLDQWSKLADAATPDWSNRCREFSNSERPRHIWSDPYGWVGSMDRVEDAELAAESRTALPLLIAEVQQLTAQLTVCEEALQGFNLNQEVLDSYSDCLGSTSYCGWPIERYRAVTAAIAKLKEMRR